MKARGRVFWKVALSFGLLGVVVYFVDFRQVAEMMTSIRRIAAAVDREV